MGKGMGPCLCIAHMCFDGIVSSFGLNVYEYECIVMCGFNLLM